MTTLDEDSIGNPRILALSDNVAVDNQEGNIHAHQSTLGGIVALQWEKWDTWYAAYTVSP